MPDQTNLTPIEEQVRAWEEYHRKRWMEIAESDFNDVARDTVEGLVMTKPEEGWTEKDEEQLQQRIEQRRQHFMWIAAERFSDWLSEYRPDVETALSEISAQQSEWAEQGA